MTPEADPSDLQRPLSPRMRRWTFAVVTTFALCALGWFVLRPSPSTVFSVNADTGSVEVQPLCADKIVWDLPPGEVQARTCGLEDPQHSAADSCCGCTGRVTATLLGGATAKIEAEGPDTWFVTFGTAATACAIQNPAPIELSVGDRVLRDTEGYFYRPLPPGGATNGAASSTARSSNAPLLTLILEGRVVIGQSIKFGGGWNASPSPMLNRAKLVARDRAVATGWPLTIIEEDIEPGTIVDTHLGLADAIADLSGTTEGVPRSTGFVQLFDDRLAVQIYQPRSIGLLPYASPARILKVPRWRPLWASPAVQFVVSSLVLLASIVSLVFAYSQAREKLPQLWSSGGALDRDGRKIP